ncbi:hypothetical protein LR48_Vigan09g212900 [Vigna angularis]|uniref:Uncharacterized protein n=1 Tax=Phaseolus angularis TaxID=3914 RepID=A0A0L9VEK6_PHAAN|nr:hypothetical protein LR48_Vigan09g212900 [Vigna angularis]
MTDTVKLRSDAFKMKFGSMSIGIQFKHRILTFHKLCALPCYASRDFYDEKHGWKKIYQVEENRAAAKGEALHYEDLYLYAA